MWHEVCCTERRDDEGNQDNQGIDVMKKAMLARVVVVAVAGLLIAQSASALAIRRAAGYYSGSGGEFTVFGAGYADNYDMDATRLSATYGLGFQTFCLEMNEYYTTSPDGFTIECFAIEGGKGGIDSDLGGDPISMGTAWLYKEFSDGLLSGYDYDVTGRFKIPT